MAACERAARNVQIPKGDNRVNYRLAIITTIFSLFGTNALAQSTAGSTSFPEKGRQINVVVPWGAGGMIDLLARTLSRAWDQKWGTASIVINKPGAGGQLGISEMLRQKPDGYTVAFAHGFDTQMTYLDATVNAPYSRSSLEFIGLAQRTPEVWVVRADSPFKRAEDFFNAVKANPDGINFGATSSRSTAIIYAQKIKEKFGAGVTLVPHADVPSTINSLLGGNIDIAMSNAAVAHPYVKSGKLRVLVVAGAKPSKYFPGAETSAQAGLELPDLNYTGVALPKGTPPHVVAAWANMLKDIVSDPKIKAQMDDMAVNLDYLSPADFKKLWVQTEDYAATVLKTIGTGVRPVN